MEIKIGKFLIHKTSRCFIVGKATKRKDKEGLPELTDKTFYPTVETMLKTLPDRLLFDESEAKSFNELLSDYRKFKLEVEMALSNIH